MLTKKVKSSLIVKSNELINARLSGFNLSQHRLLDILISQLDKDQGKFQKQRVYFKDFVDKTGTAHKGETVRAREITKSLMKKVVEVFEDGKLRQRNLFHSADYPENEPYVEIVFHPDLRPYLLELSRNFTSYDLKNTLIVKSVYSVRMYQILKQYAYRKQVTFDIEELKSLLDAENYKLYADFKRNCINVAEKELKKKCDLTFSFEEIKQGRKVGRIRFTIRVRLDTIPEELSKQAEVAPHKLIRELMDMGISLKQAQAYTSSHDLEDIEKKIQYTQKQLNQGKVKKPGAYLKKILDDGAVLEAPILRTKQNLKKGKTNGQDILKQKQRENDQLVENLQVEFEKVRHAESEKAIATFNDQDWQEFGDFAKTIPSSNLFVEGRLNRNSPKFEHYSTVFASGKLPAYHEHFINWARQMHGLTLRQRKGDDTRFDLVKE